jgi:arylsulfatase A-like enzyme
MLREPSSGGKEIAYTVVTRGKFLGKAIRTQRYRYTWWPTGEELFDVNDDPQEETNLANSPEYAKTLEKMRTNLASAEAIAVSKSR